MTEIRIDRITENVDRSINRIGNIVALKLVSEIIGVDAMTNQRLTKEQLIRLTLWKAMEDILLTDGRLHTFDVKDIKCDLQPQRHEAQQELKVTATIHYWLTRPEDAKNGDVLHISAIRRPAQPEPKEGEPPPPEPATISVEAYGKLFIYAGGDWHCHGPVKT